MLRNTKKPKAKQESSYFAQYKPHPDEGEPPAEGHLSREKAKSLTIILGQRWLQDNPQAAPSKNDTAPQPEPQTTLIGITRGPLRAPLVDMTPSFTQGLRRDPILEMAPSVKPRFD